MFSIVIPTYRNYKTLAVCMAAVHASTTGDYELLVIDNGATPRGYVWAANRGLEMAQGDPIIIMNDDIVVKEGWIEPILYALKHDDQLWLCSPNLDSIGPCAVWRREAYEYLGGYDTRYIHWLADGELEKQLRTLGKHYYTVPDSEVEHIRSTDSYVNVDLLRSWHLHDYGHLPSTW